jgi:uncharacterized protein YbjT (DUF2867 family)
MRVTGDSLAVACVIGATGLVGSNLVQRLILDDDFSKIIVFSRRKLSVENEKLETIITDFSNLKKISELVKGDVFFSTLGTTKKKAGSIKAQREVDFSYQLEFAQIAKKNNFQHYVLISSAGANAKSSNAYLKMKGELEDEVIKLSFPRISIIQPSLLLGERSDFRIGEKLGELILPLVTSLSPLKKYKPIAGEDVAIAMIQSFKKQSQKMQIYSLDQVHHLSYGDI